MRKIKIIEHISIDGIVQITGEDDDFPYENWTAPYRTPSGVQAVADAQGDNFDLILGRRTYDQWSDFWPKAPPSRISDSLNFAKKYVVTHRPESLQWGPVQPVGPDLLGGIRAIKEIDGPNLVLWGSPTITSALFDCGLVDEVALIVYPVLLGTGKPFFANGTPARTLELLNAKAIASGIIVSSYRVNGPLQAT